MNNRNEKIARELTESLGSGFFNMSCSKCALYGEDICRAICEDGFDGIVEAGMMLDRIKHMEGLAND